MSAPCFKGAGSSPGLPPLRRPGVRALTAALATLLVVCGCQTLRERSAKEESLAAVPLKERAAVDAVIPRALERCVTIRPAFLTVGSGCIVTSDGWILTAEHVVRGRRTVEVELPDGSSHDGRVVATSGGNDFALVKIEAHDLKYFRLGHRPTLGDRVIAVGTSSKWVTPNASAGVVIYPRVRIPGEEGTYYFDALFYSAPIFPGDSGGPLVNLAGELVGINGGFASETASVAPAAVEIMRVLPGGGKKRLTLDLFRDPSGKADWPIVWPARLPRNFAESSEWTIGSVEDTLVEVYAPQDRDFIRRILETTRSRYVARRATDPRRDDELIRAMLADVFRQLDERTRTATAAAVEQRPTTRRPRRRRRRGRGAETRTRTRTRTGSGGRSDAKTRSAHGHRHRHPDRACRILRSAE